MLKNIQKVAKAKITSWDPKINRKPNISFGEDTDSEPEPLAEPVLGLATVAR